MPFSEHTAGRSTPTGNPYELFAPTQGLIAEDYQLHGDQPGDRSEQDLYSGQLAALSFDPQQDVQRNLYQPLHRDPTFFEIPGPIPEANNPNERFDRIEDRVFHYDPLTDAYEDDPLTLTDAYEDDPLTLTNAYEDDPLTLTNAYDVDPITLTNAYDVDPITLTNAYDVDPITLTNAYDVTIAQYNQAHGDPTFIEHTPAGGPYDPLTAAYDVTIAQYNQAHGDQTSSLSWQDSSSGLPAALSFYRQPEAQNAHYQPPHGDPTSDRSGPGSSSNSTFRPQNAAPHNLELPQEGPGSSLHRFNNPRLKLSADEQQAEAKARADSARRVQDTRDRATMLREFFNEYHLSRLDKKEGKEGTEYPYIPQSRKENGKTEDFRTPGAVLREVDKVLQKRKDAGMEKVPDLTYLTGNQEEALRQAEQFAQLEKDSDADQRSDEDEAPANKQKWSREQADMLRKYINEHHLRPRDLKEGTKYPYLTTQSELKGKDGKKLRLQTVGNVLREVPNVLQKRKDAGMKNVPNLAYLTGKGNQEKALRKAALFEKQGDDYQSDGE
ncbi:hypothetical protein [Dictyobacter arantiisoli]|uniref:Uncharacterized protein n=1 Tax=Dictyobacter arantiisoli TaxID=2014874 RepID=A0A5A5TL25_9CHLR|nr:hypothetical protein [Dictyobacter arantiisoli]GCF12022.1 hypothetical protein KDI_55860 [Dictyobacter arantiisoli]